MQFIPGWVNVLDAPKEYRMIERPMLEVVKTGHFKIARSRLWAKHKFAQYRRKNRPKDGNAIFGYVGKYVTPHLPSLADLGEYDAAISYLTPHNIVAEKIKARKKIAWIHTDYSKIDVDSELELPVWASYDKIVSISSDVSKSFLKVFPSLKEKLIEIENFLPLEVIRARAEAFEAEEMRKKDNETVFLTIGRYCEAKRIDEIPAMARILKESGVRFRWYVIGYGHETELTKIKNNTKTHGVEEEIVLLGKKENPYPYIRACDIYVQPSRYEGKSITVREAQVLGKLVVITGYATSDSQLKNGFDGLIGPYKTEQFAEYLVKVVNESEVRDNIRNNLSKMNFAGEGDINLLLSLTEQSKS